MLRARPVSDTAFEVSGDRAAEYPTGRRLRLGHGHGSFVELEVVSASVAGDMTRVTFRRLGRIPDQGPRPSGWTAGALRVHDAIARMEARRGSLTGGIIHDARRYDLMWGRLLSLTDRAIVRRLGTAPGDRVLDLGCGPGDLTRAVARAAGFSGSAVGIDASPEMIERARRKTRGGSVTFVETHAETLPFPDASFDAVVSRLLLHELLDGELAAGIAEIARVLRPDGRVLLIDLPGPALDQARAELAATGRTCEVGTVGFPFFHFVAFRAGP